MEWLGKVSSQGWILISREERLFCAHLYHDIRRDAAPFLALWGLSDKPVDIGFEVCLLRDVANFGGEKRTKKPFNKLTFDLVLFYPDQLFVIEAKAHQRFGLKQANDLLKARRYIRDELGISPEKVHLYGLCSSRYRSSDRYKGRFFERIQTWQAVLQAYPRNRDVYARADAVFAT